MGQLCAELKVTREEYCRNVLGKRKREEVDPLLAKVHMLQISTLRRMNQLIVACNAVSKSLSFAAQDMYSNVVTSFLNCPLVHLWLRNAGTPHWHPH
jgi:hypothetical protein